MIKINALGRLRRHKRDHDLDACHLNHHHGLTAMIPTITIASIALAFLLSTAVVATLLQGPRRQLSPVPVRRRRR